jgi:hypothetical protein
MGSKKTPAVSLNINAWIFKQDIANYYENTLDTDFNRPI